MDNLSFSSGHNCGARPDSRRRYYFNGWSGETDNLHLPDRLKTELLDREPVWGWHANTQAIIDQEIELAADHGIGFFAYDWYWPSNMDDKKTPLNNALDLYLSSKHKSHSASASWSPIMVTTR